ncbi:hypothetical protein [Clostridium sp.]|uniref:hypothetical protein n=1 Tax=Clostridium sp. TaxID=1506 RepID=UPI0025C68A8C|nr:hypothetical protein [Clostridium sp.]
MLGHIGFSYIGLIYLLMLFIPNIIWTKHQSENYDYSNENKILLIFERVGQVAVTCCALIFLDFNITTFSLWSIWLIASFILMIIYEMYWIRYIKGKPTLKNFYRSFCYIPVPGATLPVIAFLLLGIYGKVIWMIISTIILGVGHIGIHFQHLKEIKYK